MRKLYKLYIAALLAVLVVFTFCDIGNVSDVYADEETPQITLGQVINVPAVEGYHKCEVNFIPEESGYYVIEVDEKNTDYTNGSYLSVSVDGSSVYSYSGPNNYSGSKNFRKYSMTAGRTYTIKLSYKAKEDSSLTFKLDVPKMFLEYASIYDKNLNSSYNNGITLTYTGKAFDMKKYVLTYEKQIESGSIVTPYEYGKDYKIVKYTSAKNYSNSRALGDSLLWKEGSPIEKGDYVVRFEGLGDITGYYDLPVTIESEFDPEYVDINELESTKKDIVLDVGETLVYAIRPKTTGNYVILTKWIEDVGLSLFSAVFDSNGSVCEQSFLSEDSYYGPALSSGIYLTLEEGKVYYLCVAVEGSYSSSSEESTGKHKGQILVFGEGAAYIYKDPNAPDIKEEDKTAKDTSKTDDKQESKTDSSQQKADVTSKQPDTNTVALAKGKKFTVGNYTYKVTTSKKGNYQVSLVSCKNKKLKSVNVLDSVKYKGVSYKVTGIGANTFKGMSSLTTVTIKCTKLTKVGANAFKGINKNAVIKVPKTKKKAYTKLLKGKGQAKTVKIK